MDKPGIFLTISLLVLLILVSAFSFMLGKETTITTMAIAELETIETPTGPAKFNAYTEAFCEDKEFYKECKDLLVVECGNTKQKVSIVDGSANVELMGN
jgi:hypothetical protein|tara:strand:+ start:1762 stop:2058 length:297 start_codon:yes stop_codon:yes gene_type:complete